VLPALTRRLALVLLAVAGLRLVLPESLPGGVWGINAVIALLVVLDIVLAPSPRSFEIGRQLPDQVALRATAEVALVVRNQHRRAVSISLADELAPSLRAGTRRWRVRVPGRSEVRLSTTIHPGRRGRFEPSRVVLRAEGPLGLGARQRTIEVPGRLKVVPAFPSRKDAELRLARAKRLELGVRSVRMLGTGTDFDQLREYTPDDDFRRIDWAATARGGRPIVRMYRAERNQTVLVLVEVGRNMAGRVAGVPRLEHALDAVFALTTVATGLQDQVGLVAYDDQIRASLAPSHRADQLAHVVEAVYELEPELLETDHLSAFSHTLARFRRRTTLVVCTDLTEATVTETLLPALPLVLRDHLVVIVAVTDPEVAAWAAERVTDDDGLYRRAAATGALEERARLAARLRGLGALVVDAPPGQVASRLVDVYLTARWGGRL